MSITIDGIKLCVGDKVKVINDEGISWNSGEILTIRSIKRSSQNKYTKIWKQGALSKTELYGGIKDFWTKYIKVCCKCENKNCPTVRNK